MHLDKRRAQILGIVVMAMVSWTQRHCQAQSQEFSPVSLAILFMLVGQKMESQDTGANLGVSCTPERNKPAYQGLDYDENLVSLHGL